MALEMRKGDVLLPHDSGLVSQCVVEEDVVGQGTGLSVADRRRNARLDRLRGLVPVGNAVLGIDLADDRQYAVLCDHDSRVLKRWTVTGKAWQLGPLLDRALSRAVAAGFESVTVACEPTGHRWRIIEQMADDRGLAMVCIQPLVMRRAREQEDLTTEKTDAKDAVLIARLAARLHCYVPERVDGRWAQLRQAGIRRERLVVDRTAQRQQVRDLLECVWPAALARAPRAPFDSATWLACVHVAATGCDDDGQSHRLRGQGMAAFTAAVRAALPRFAGIRVRHSIVAAMFAALADPTGVRSHRAAALRRIGWVLDDMTTTGHRLAEVETHMTATLDQLDLTTLLCSIPGLSPVGAAAILAETGDPTRFSHARALVKHAGLAPRAHQSGHYTGTTRITGRGRPRLRLAAWRAVFGALPHNPVMRDRHQHLTERPNNPLSTGQARASLAAALLRWIYVIITKRIPFHALTAAGKSTTHTPDQPPLAA
ncbi:IS110 family transposase [Polymorphospora rubra]|uniref:IS110 family transposase n=1 Tax=Polymorphospora rubra TaxID=338584 RepID=UPI0033DE8F70